MFSTLSNTVSTARQQFETPHTCEEVYDDPNIKVHLAAGETVPLNRQTEGFARWFLVARHSSGLVCPDQGKHKNVVQLTSPNPERKPWSQCDHDLVGHRLAELRLASKRKWYGWSLSLGGAFNMCRKTCCKCVRVCRKTISNELASGFSGAFCCPPGRKHALKHTKTQGLSVSNRNTVCDKKDYILFLF